MTTYSHSKGYLFRKLQLIMFLVHIYMWKNDDVVAFKIYKNGQLIHFWFFVLKNRNVTI